MFKKNKNRFLLVLLLFFSFTLSTNVKAQMSKFQALYIYNICRYVEWSSTDFSNNEFVIGIVGRNVELEKSLLAISQSKTIQNKKVVVKIIASATQSMGCNIVFFSKGKENQIEAFKESSPNSLYFSESNNALKKGSDINFVIRDNRLKFELGKTNISKKPLRTSAELNQLATNVI